MSLKNNLVFLLGLIIIAFGAIKTRAQDRMYGMGLPFITSYNPKDYNGESQNWAFVQDNDDVLIIANTIGFIEYDGVSWRQIVSNVEGIPLSLAIDDNGIIYGGGTGFIGRFEVDSVGSMVFKSLSNLLPPDFFLDFVFTTTSYKGKIYFQNQENIICWDGQEMNIFEFPDKIELLIPSDGHLYVDTKSSFYEIVNDSIHQPMWAENLGDLRVRSVNRIGPDTVLVGTNSQGIFLLNKGKLRKIDLGLEKFFKDNFLFTSLKLPDGRIAFGTKRAGVIILNQDLSVYYRITASGGLADNDIKNLYLNKDNRLWIATNNGFSSLSYPIEFTYFDASLGIASTVEEITEFKDELIVGTFLGSLKLGKRKVDEIFSEHPYARFEQIAGTDINNMALMAIDEKLLIGTSVGTMIYDGSTLKPFDNKEARKFYISQIDDEIVFEGHRYGCDILIFDAGKLKSRIPIEGLSDQIRGIAQGDNGTVWLSTMVNGVYSFSLAENHKVVGLKHYSLEDGLPAMRDNLTYKVKDKVIFTTQRGLYSFDSQEGKFVPDATYDSIYADNSRFVYAFYFDENEDVWIHSFRKMETAKATLQDDGSYINDRESFTALKFMQMYEVYKQANGTAWFGGSDGLARYEPNKIDFNRRSSFKGKIRKVIVNEDSVLFYGNYTNRFIMPILGPDDNNLRFESAGLYFDSGNEYQYFLEGYDKTWSSWGNEPFKIYTNLNHGFYSFKMRAKNTKGIVSSLDSFNLEILPPWYLTWWFIVVASALFIAAISFFVRYFATRKLIKRVEELELIQTAQTQRERISRDLHDNVGSNLTYIISSLDYITFKSDKDEKIAEKANDLSDFTRDTMNQLRDTIWHISSEEVTIDKFVGRVQKLLLRLKDIKRDMFTDVKVSADASVVLPPILALSLFRVVQEAINNSFKHSNASELIILINLSRTNKLMLEIKDNGVGFDIDNDKEGHYGLENMKNRMKDIDGSLEVKSKKDVGTNIVASIDL